MEERRVAHMKSLLGRWLVSLLLLLGCSPAVAVTEGELCRYEMLTSAFKEVVASLEQPQVETLQKQLNEGGYGALVEDGILGAETRIALQRLCRAFAVEEEEGVAEYLILLLDINSQVIKRYPQWRLTIQSEEFKEWLASATVERQTEITEIMQEGPAQQIIATLDEFTDKVVRDQSRVAPDDAPEGYYQWSGVPPPPAEGAKATSTEESEKSEELPPEVVKALEVMVGVAYPNPMLFRKALKKALAERGADYWRYLTPILAMAHQTPEKSLQPLQLSGAGCGCSRNLSSVVYGFYPYWLANNKEAQRVDFSIIDRLAFYALSLDREGNINDPLQWSDDWNVAAFIHQAHKYRVEVDLTLYATDWMHWTDEVIERAARTSAAAVTQKFTHTDASLLGDIVPQLGDPSWAQGDGVTLVFDHFSGEVEQSAKIVKFVEQLAQRLPAHPNRLKLNIMLGLDVSTLEQRPVFKTLETILLAGNNPHALVDYLLIFLQEPTTDAKKMLRQKIEIEFHGANRKEVLRKIVPVLTSTGHDKTSRGVFTQFTDDLIYFQDNFAGVGLWPLPLESDTAVEKLKQILIGLYTSTTGYNVVGELYAARNSDSDGDGDGAAAIKTAGGAQDIFATALCRIVCPERYLFRITFSLMAGLLIAYALLSIWICSWRELSKKYFWYLLGMVLFTLAIFVVSLVCDPTLQQHADVILVTLLLLGALYSLWRYISKATQPPLP